MTFLQAAAFQWVNPKGWAMALGAVTAYAALATYPGNIIIMAAVFALLGLVSSWTWVLFGLGLKRMIRSPRMLRAVNVAMALALVASLYPVFAGAAA